MAVSPIQPQDYEAVDLRAFRGTHLDALLQEQTAYWRDNLLWDFSGSADVIRRFLDSRSLSGFALVRAGFPVGYSYFVHESRKALVGDLFICAAERCEQAERTLLHSTIKAAVALPGVRRIEGQLLGLTFNPRDEVIYGRPLTVFERHFMVLDDLARFPRLSKTPACVDYQAWSDYFLDGAAELVARSYHKHVDSLINDQYRSFDGARRFLYNTTQHPGCGVFYRPAASVATDRVSHKMLGICLGSLVHSDVGHVTQIAVTPEAQGRGVGFELLRKSIEAFHRHGSRAVSLTVTRSNETALALYYRVGFRSLRRFHAFVWETA